MPSLLPRSDPHLLLSRPAGAPPAFDVPGVRVEVIDQPSAPLEAFAAAQGFPAGWTTDMLSDAASAMLALDDKMGAAVAMAWTTTKPFYVDEIGATLDPAASGATYLFGDFVAPAHRGRGLQRLLVVRRLQLVAAGPTYTIIHPTNVASMKSYERAGFVATARFARKHWLRRSWATCRSVTHGPLGFEWDGDGTIRVTSA